MIKEIRRIKLLYLVSSLRPCGPTNQLCNILKYLDRERFEPLVVTLSPEKTASDLTAISGLGVDIQTLGLSRVGGMIFGRSHFKKILEKYAPDIIHSQGIRSDILSSGIKRAYIVLATLRNYPFHDYPMKFGPVLGRIMAWRHLRALAKIRTVVACSKSVLQKMEFLGPDLHVIQNGIDVDRFNSAGELDIQRFRQRWGVDSGERVFVTCGALIQRKDPLALIHGFLSSSVLRQDHLFILGDGPLREECERATGSTSRIHILGQVSDVRPYLQGADYFLSASHSEGLPNALLEALACGLPVAVSDIPSHREILSLSPKSAEFFPVGDVPRINKALEVLRKTPRNMRSVAARLLVSEHFDASKMSHLYQELYCDILKGKNLA